MLKTPGEHLTKYFSILLKILSARCAIDRGKSKARNIINVRKKQIYFSRFGSTDIFFYVSTYNLIMNIALRVYVTTKVSLFIRYVLDCFVKPWLLNKPNVNGVALRDQYLSLKCC